MCQFVVRCSCSTTSFDKGSRYGRLEADHAASMAVRSNECPALVTARAGVSREEERERKLFSSHSRLARRDALTGSRYNTCVIGHRSSGGSSTVRGGRAILFTKRLRSVQKKRQKTAPSCCRHARNTETKVDKGVERVRRTFSGAASSRRVDELWRLHTKDGNFSFYFKNLTSAHIQFLIITSHHYNLPAIGDSYRYTRLRQVNPCIRAERFQMTQAPIFAS